jgi:PAS domain S-box-containing protein
LLEAAPDAILAVGRDGRIVLANRKTEQLFGYTLDELIGAKLEKLIPERFRASHREQRSGYFEDPRSRPMGAGLDLYARRSDGSEFPAEISLSSIETEDGILATAAIRDVTDRKAMERGRLAAEERFQVAFAEAGVPMAIVALEGRDRGRLLDANLAYARMLGREFDEIVGRNVSSWVHPDDLETAVHEPLARLAAGDADRVEFERRYIHGDGHVIWSLVTDATFHSEDGRRVAIGQILDISERKTFEGQLQYQADHDALTGLYNRRRFEFELSRSSRT